VVAAELRFLLDLLDQLVVLVQPALSLLRLSEPTPDLSALEEQEAVKPQDAFEPGPKSARPAHQRSLY
jgi:hypothetical protein